MSLSAALNSQNKAVYSWAFGKIAQKIKLGNLN